MKTALTFLALILCISSYAQDTISVSDPSDKRLLAYRDSLACYQFSQYQLELAQYIQNPNDTAQGRISMIQLEAKRIALHLSDRYKLRDFDQWSFHKAKIKPVRYDTKRIMYKSTFAGDYYWGPAIYVKPTIVVLFNHKQND